jgi:hypothetical protein
MRSIRTFFVPYGLLGLLGSVITFAKPLIWIIDRLSEIDFLATHSGAFGRFLNTGWGTLASVGVGATIIGFSIFQGLRQPALANIRAPNKTPKATGAALSYEWGLLHEPIVEPRIDTISMRQVTTATELYERAEGQEVIIVHYLSGLDDKTRCAAENLCTILRSLMFDKAEQKEPLHPWERDELCEKLHQKMVILKGNDILIYADTHYKWLPERNNIPDAPDSIMAEFQLIIAFRRREEYEDNFSVVVSVDNGQPRLRRHGLKPKTSPAS